MLIGIIQSKGRSLPAFICDHCGKEIANADMGNYLWQGQDSIVTDIKYLHKSCTPSYEAKLGEVEGAMELDYLLFHLLKNMGMSKEKIKRAVEKAVFLNSIG